MTGYKNLVVTGGVFPQNTAIRTIIVPSGGLKEGALLGKVTATKKFKLSVKAASDGSEKAKVILEKDIENKTGSDIEVKEVVYTSGVFNNLGVTFGTGQTLENTYDELHSNSIEIIKGVM